MKLIKEIFVPIDARYLMTPIMAKQSDYGSRFFKVHLTRGGEEIAANEWKEIALVAICITRADGQSKAFAGVFNSAENAFELPLPLWAVEVYGDKSSFDVMIQYTNDDGETAVVRSALVPLSIQKSIFKSTDISEDDERLDFLTELINKTAELEKGVKTAEAARVVAEQDRVDAEAQRAQNEAARVTAEALRETAEQTRVSNEDTRKSNETTRKSNETKRANAETARATAEETRQNQFEIAKTACETATQAANKAAEFVTEILLSVKVTIPASKWTNKTATLSEADNKLFGKLTANSCVEFIADDGSAATVVTCNIQAATVSSGSISLTCDTAPTVSISATIIILTF